MKQTQPPPWRCSEPWIAQKWARPWGNDLLVLFAPKYEEHFFLEGYDSKICVSQGSIQHDRLCSTCVTCFRRFEYMRMTHNTEILHFISTRWHNCSRRDARSLHTVLCWTFGPVMVELTGGFNVCKKSETQQNMCSFMSCSFCVLVLQLPMKRQCGPSLHEVV